MSQQQKKKSSPLIRSVTLVRILAAGITMLSLGGMTVYASDHLYNAAAPLQPATARTAAPVATSPTARTTTGRIQLSAGVPTTTTPPITKTHRS
jgi:hypothetical protein